MANTILVTGGSGFIGAHTVRALADHGHDVVATRHRSGGDLPEIWHDIANRVRVEQVNVFDSEALTRLVRRQPLDAIVHLAAADRSATAVAQALRSDTDAVLSLTAAAQEHGVHRVVLASSLGVYWGLDGSSFAEDSLLSATTPLNIVAAKRIAELVAGLLAAGGMDVVSARLSTIWGPLHRSKTPVMPRLVHSALTAGPLPLGEGHEPLYAEDGRDLCYVKDCAEGLALLATADSLAHRIYNVGDGRPTRPAEVADRLGSLLQRTRTPLPPGRDPAGPDHDTWLDITRLTADTGYRPAYGLERGLPDYVDWLRAGHRR